MPKYHPQHDFHSPCRSGFGSPVGFPTSQVIGIFAVILKLNRLLEIFKQSLIDHSSMMVLSIPNLLELARVISLLKRATSIMVDKVAVTRCTMSSWFCSLHSASVRMRKQRPTEENKIVQGNSCFPLKCSY
ncbi:uncharacterized protein ACOB8E_006313 isoform 1-T1 [Sarcophilus harrisii]